ELHAGLGGPVVQDLEEVAGGVVERHGRRRGLVNPDLSWVGERGRGGVERGRDDGAEGRSEGGERLRTQRGSGATSHSEGRELAGAVQLDEGVERDEGDQERGRRGEGCERALVGAWMDDVPCQADVERVSGADERLRPDDASAAARNADVGRI